MTGSQFQVVCHLTNVIEAFSSKPKYELSIHFACGAGTYIFEDEETKKFVPLTKFCDIQGMLELFEDKAEEIRSGKNKYFTMLRSCKKTQRICRFQETTSRIRSWQRCLETS